VVLLEGCGTLGSWGLLGQRWGGISHRWWVLEEDYGTPTCFLFSFAFWLMRQMVLLCHVRSSWHSALSEAQSNEPHDHGLEPSKPQTGPFLFGSYRDGKFTSIVCYLNIVRLNQKLVIEQYR
jgi:hypothetical protein